MWEQGERLRLHKLLLMDAQGHCYGKYKGSSAMQEAINRRRVRDVGVPACVGARTSIVPSPKGHARFNPPLSVVREA